MSKKEWFGEWFDSPYYHILYKDRDDDEAQNFIDNLSEYLAVSATDKVLDLACGKGRHSIYLNSKGFDVVGLDLSPQSIEFASQFSNDKLQFGVHDMREIYEPLQFDYIFNLFTSFGYFDEEQENIKTLQSVKAELKEGGVFVLDFMNTEKIINNLVSSEKKEIEGIQFSITREVVNEYLQKDIRFEDEGQRFHFQEKVKVLYQKDFEKYFMESGLKMNRIFGNYQLGEYEESTSDRMIFITQK